MVKMTRHAVERLDERFGIADRKGITNIRKIVSRENAYKLVQAREEIREIVYEGKTIQVVVINDVAVTALGEYEKKKRRANAYIKHSQNLRINDALEELHDLKINLVEMEGILAALKLNKWNDAVKELSKLRRG